MLHKVEGGQCDEEQKQLVKIVPLGFLDKRCPLVQVGHERICGGLVKHGQPQDKGNLPVSHMRA